MRKENQGQISGTNKNKKNYNGTNGRADKDFERRCGSVSRTKFVKRGHEKALKNKNLKFTPFFSITLFNFLVVIAVILKGRVCVRGWVPRLWVAAKPMVERVYHSTIWISRSLRGCRM
jgi:hypothetical protein